MILDEAIKHCEEVAETKEKEGSLNQESFMPLNEFMRYRVECLECASEHRQLAEWLSELKAYKDLSTYNRENKCCECEYEDSEYFCDDCIWNFVDKFKQREVNADGDSD